jgi:hypothetical protein
MAKILLALAIKYGFYEKDCSITKVVVIDDRKISTVRKWTGCNNAQQLLDFFSSTARGVYLLLFTLALRNLNVVCSFESGENFECSSD